MATVGRENCRRKSKEKERISMHKKKFSLLDHREYTVEQQGTYWEVIS